jgi:hypothetical protein
MYFSPLPCYLVCLKPKYSPQRQLRQADYSAKAKVRISCPCTPIPAKFRTVTILISLIQTNVFHTIYVVRCTVYGHTKFHMPNSDSPLMIDIEATAKCRFHVCAVFLFDTTWDTVHIIYCVWGDSCGSRC